MECQTMRYEGCSFLFRLDIGFWLLLGGSSSGWVGGVRFFQLIRVPLG